MAIIQRSGASSFLVEIKNPDNKFPFYRFNKIVPRSFSYKFNLGKPKKNLIYGCCFRVSSSLEKEAQSLVHRFNPQIPIEEALTPPSSWYTDPSFFSLELQQVFYKGWQAVGYTEQIKDPHQYFTGRLGNVEYVVSRDGNGKLHAFHNVCRHHASLLASGSGQKPCFVCPYHGWTYGLDGTLLKATRISGIKNFKVHEMGLIPLRVAIWGPFVLLNFETANLLPQESENNVVEDEWLGSSLEILSSRIDDSSLSFFCRREYTINCNWKVFCDNYLDGGYHVPYAHKGLASGLKLESYSSIVYEKVSIQKCDGDATESDPDFDRLGSKALYAFIYPNFMVNRYGPWMDTNLVVPLGPRKCQVIFDYFLDNSIKNLMVFLGMLFVWSEISAKQPSLHTERNEYEPNLQDDHDFIERSLKDSEKVQVEDIILCESVQRGIESPAYCCGRYAPTVEKPMHHFHCLLYGNLCN